MAKDDDFLNNIVDDHRECQLFPKHFITLAERELTICICLPQSCPGYSPEATPKKKQVADSTLVQSCVKVRERLRRAQTNVTTTKSNTTTKSLDTHTPHRLSVLNLQSLNEHAMTIGQKISMSAKAVCSFKEAHPSKPRLAKPDSAQNSIGRSVSLDVTNNHCLYSFGPIQYRLKAASYPGLKKGCFLSDTVPNGHLKGTIIKRDKSSNATSWEVALNCTVFGNSKVFHPQVVESLDISDDESNCAYTFIRAISSLQGSFIIYRSLSQVRQIPNT
jgi:hypothetical protein